MLGDRAAIGTIGELPPGSTIGVVGGGQLGRMLARAAQRLGYRVAVLSGGPEHSPAGSVAETEIAAPFHDRGAWRELSTTADVITWEFENVDTEPAALAALAGVAVRPDAELIALAQDREHEKAMLERAGLPVVSWRPAASLDELASALDGLGGPVIAKSVRFGYDGRRQARIDSPARLDEVWRELGASRLVVEEVVAFRQELSVVVARGSTGEMVDHGVMGNVHVNGMLDTTVTPADVPEAVSDEARRLARRVAEVVGLCGVLCVELFWVDGRLLVNEIAPRPHNSGHCTIEAAPCGQFEQQVRAICGLPLGDGACRPAAMVQLLGDLWHDGEPRWSRILADPMISLHLYGKSEALPGRKMGHLTCVDSSADAALERLLAARARLGRA